MSASIELHMPHSFGRVGETWLRSKWQCSSRLRWRITNFNIYIIKALRPSLLLRAQEPIPVYRLLVRYVPAWARALNNSSERITITSTHLGRWRSHSPVWLARARWGRRWLRVLVTHLVAIMRLAMDSQQWHFNESRHCITYRLVRAFNSNIQIFRLNGGEGCQFNV